MAADNTNKQIILSMRGSVSLSNWIADIKFVQMACPKYGGAGAACSIGFLGFWEQSRPDAMKGIKAAQAEHPEYQLVVTGHSLGAAAAVYAASELRQAGNKNTLLVCWILAILFLACVDFSSTPTVNPALAMRFCRSSLHNRDKG